MDLAEQSVRVFVQARMTSRRFPGKVLAPFRGRPILGHIVGSIHLALPGVPVTVVTSDDASDDPIASYGSSIGISTFRGPLDDVFERFRRGLQRHPATWVARVNGDSPLLAGHVLRMVTAHARRRDVDLVTTIFPRTFPRGHNVELIHVDTFMRIDRSELTPDDREHVTAFYYRNPGRFRIVNVHSGDPQLADIGLTVDSIEDLRRLEATADAILRTLPYDAVVAVAG